MKKKRKKKLKRKRILFFLLLIIIIICFIFIKSYIAKISLLNNIDKDNYANINYYDIYGTHFNLKGTIKFDDNVKDLKLVLTNGGNEKNISWEIKKKNGKYIFSTSKYINKGINLEKLVQGHYYLLIRGKINNKTIYYSLKNNTDYGNLEYYTLTKNGNNNKININWDNVNTKTLLNVDVTQKTLPNDVYDITIDPGHDANDSGKMACSDGSPVTNTGKCLSGKLYKEADVNLAVSKELKKQLEYLGFKVKITRDSKNDVVPTYDKHGSATTANETKSKFNLALHHNSSGISGGESYLMGLEVYIANDTDLKLAKLFVKNIKKYAKTVTSPKELDLVQDGIYQRFFTEDELIGDDLPKNKNTNTIYYYFLREVGGIATHAYVEENEYYNSNQTAEPYLFELGYLDNVADLKNIIKNKEGYAKGIAYALKDYLENS